MAKPPRTLDQKSRSSTGNIISPFPVTMFGGFPIAAESLRRFGVSDTGAFHDVPPSGYPTGLQQYWNQDRLHYASRNGKYPVPTPDNQQPGQWECGQPSISPGHGCFVRVQRVLKQSDANRVNPTPEWMGDTIVDSYVPGTSPIIAQQLQQNPFATRATMISMGWQEPRSLLSTTNGRTFGETGRTP